MSMASSLSPDREKVDSFKIRRASFSSITEGMGCTAAPRIVRVPIPAHQRPSWHPELAVPSPFLRSLCLPRRLPADTPLLRIEPRPTRPERRNSDEELSKHEKLWSLMSTYLASGGEPGAFPAVLHALDLFLCWKLFVYEARCA